MFEQFRLHYPRDPWGMELGNSSNLQNLSDLSEFLTLFGGGSYQNGLYRTVVPSTIDTWNGRITEAFPEFDGRITCFAYDWLGRAFGLDRSRLENKKPGVVMFEPGTGEALEIPCNLETFHTHELLEFGEAALAISFHDEWLATDGAVPKYDQCIGYRKPLFLNGSDQIENLELSDLDVYWYVFGQVAQQLR